MITPATPSTARFPQLKNGARFSLGRGFLSRVRRGVRM